MSERTETITAAQLLKLGACQSQVDVFRRLYGNSAKINKTNAKLGHDKFTWAWPVHKLLSPEQRVVFYDLEHRNLNEYLSVVSDRNSTFSQREAAQHKYKVSVALAFVEAYYTRDMKTAKPYNLEI